ncbi:hypothetical protein C8N24_4183 [Solirubrobacter pauli]|uniref:Uncharacterized protein n=1 Tax=Solirubrobacter pauli TaxID=166793 RepID=A0A660L2K0_9ACTN|nr:hypothetical protein C8N24_4183 [Solirubrobacter pauli]
MLRALVDTQREIVTLLDEVTSDIADLRGRVTLLESATAVRAEAQQTQSQTRRLMADAERLQLRSTNLLDGNGAV